MTDNRTVEGLRELAEKATSGPWRVYRLNDASTNVFVADDKVFIAEVGHPMHPNVTQDADYIAAASPDVILRLLDERDALLRALWQCGRESGMDTDGDAGPEAMVAGMGVVGFAAAMVEEVRELRRSYDESLDRLDETGKPG